MSISQLVGQTFTASQFSVGTNSGTDPVTYTEQDAGSDLGPNTTITIDSVNGNTFQATISGSQFSFANGTTTGTAIANTASTVIATGTIAGMSGTVFLTNNSADQPGVGGMASAPAYTDNTTYDAPCYASGTLIRTERGDVVVEALQVGDMVVTASGRLRPIRWLGHRTLDCSVHAAPHAILPIRIAAHAFGEGLPERDLYLSPGHPVLVGADDDNAGGHLVPIMCLINGTTIERMPVDEVTYWHVELDAHDVLLAEGLPAESYLDWGDRPFFSEGSDHALHNPDFVVPGLAGRCRPVAIDGPVVEAERRRLDGVFAARLATACAWPEGALAL